MIKKIINIISILLIIILSICVIKLDMLPNKFLYPLIILLLLIMVIGTIFIFKNKKYNIIFLVLFIILDIVSIIGIIYIDKTLNFMDVINVDLNEKEEYQLLTINNNNSSIKTIGIYASDENINKVLEYYRQYEIKKYTDITLLFEDLSDGKIDSVLVNENVNDLLEGDLSYLNLDLKIKDSRSILVSQETVPVKVVDVTNTKFNVYICGGDKEGNIDRKMNTDVNMIMSVDPVNKKILLTSIPRDYYVTLATKNKKDKLTHAGYYGINESIKTIENLLDIEINYYIKTNFTSIKKIIDAIGGIDVYSDYKLCTRNYCYNKGYNHMDGDKALVFARERYHYADGDIQRVKNQQNVVKGIFKKVTSSKTIISKYTNILDSLGGTLKTNLSDDSIRRIVKMQLNDMAEWKIESQNLVGTGKLTHETYTFPSLNLYVMVPNNKSLNSNRNKIKYFMGDNNEREMD